MDFLQEIFGTEALTFDQLAEKLKDSKDIKLGNLAGGAYISRDKFAALELERDGLKTQLDAANDTIKTYQDMDIDGIKKSAADWADKHASDTEALKAQLDAANYGFAVKEAVAGIQFTSESAKRAFVADLTAKALPLQEGKLLGLDDFQKAYQAQDPDAFAPEKGEKIPVATRGSSGGNPSADSLSAMRAVMGLSEKTD